MPGKKRKIPLKKVNIEIPPATVNNKYHENHFYKIITKIQNDQTSEKLYLKEMKLIYNELEHNAFMKILIQTIIVSMEATEDNPNADVILKFLCNFLAIYKDEVDTNPCKSAFEWVLETDGSNPHIRFRLCQFVNTLLSSLGTEAELDDTICDKILIYMLNRLKNSSPHVRAQAIYALQRLQSPNNPEDVVIKYFSYHLNADPSAKVRQAVISNIARNAKTIPLILERLQDIDEKVRRHTYVEMMKGFPVKSFRVAQRLKVLESGFNDESKSIKKIVAFLMLKEWFISFNENYISFLTALKLNGSDSDLKRYYKTMKLVLPALFEKQPLEKLLAVLTFRKGKKNTDGDDDENSESEDEIDEVEFIKCFPYEKMTLEHSTYWLNLVVFFDERQSSDIDLVLPEITTYCEYLIRLYEYKTNPDKSVDEWEQLEQAHTLNNLIEIFKYFDYTDEIGRENLKVFICKILKEWDLQEKSIETLMRIMENIVKDKTDRFQLINNIIHELIQPEAFEFIGDRPSMKAVLKAEANTNLQVTISQLKVSIMDLKEQITNFIAEKDYESAEKKTEELNSLKQQYNKHFTPLIKFLPESEAQSISLATEKVSSTTILKCFKIIYFMVSSEQVNSLTPAICHLYNDFIRRHTESNQTFIRNWALKCGTAFGVLYEPYSHDLFSQLRKQFFNTTNLILWETSIRAIFEMLTRYGLKHFDIADKKNRNSTSKNTRQLYRGNADYLSQDDDDDSNQGASNTATLSFLSHLFDTCTDTNIINTMIEGYCLLCLHGNIAYPEIISKLMIRYFDPDTDHKANQLLGVFFKTLLAKGKSSYLEAALLPTVTEILDSGYESTLGEVKPENVIRFILNATKPIYSLPGINIHHSIAETFLKEIYDNVTVKKEYVKVLSAQLLNLEIQEDTKVKQELQVLTEKILECEENIEEKVVKNLKNFILHLKGLYVRKSSIAFSSTRLPCDKSDNGERLNCIEEKEDEEDDGENIELKEPELDEQSENEEPIVSTVSNVVEDDVPEDIDETDDEDLLDLATVKNIRNIEQPSEETANPVENLARDEPEEEPFEPFIPASNVSITEIEKSTQSTNSPAIKSKFKKSRELTNLRRSSGLFSPVPPRLTRSNIKARKTKNAILGLTGSQTSMKKSKNSKTPVRNNYDDLTILAPATQEVVLTDSQLIEVTHIEIPETQIVTKEKSINEEVGVVNRTTLKRGPLFGPDTTVKKTRQSKKLILDLENKTISDPEPIILAPNSPELQHNKTIYDQHIEIPETQQDNLSDMDISNTSKILSQTSINSSKTSTIFERSEIIPESPIITRPTLRSVKKQKVVNAMITLRKHDKKTSPVNSPSPRKSLSATNKSASSKLSTSMSPLNLELSPSSKLSATNKSTSSKFSSSTAMSPPTLQPSQSSQSLKSSEPRRSLRSLRQDNEHEGDLSKTETNKRDSSERNSTRKSGRIAEGSPTKQQDPNFVYITLGKRSRSETSPSKNRVASPDKQKQNDEKSPTNKKTTSKIPVVVVTKLNKSPKKTTKPINNLISKIPQRVLANVERPSRLKSKMENERLKAVTTESESPSLRRASPRTKSKTKR